MRKLVAVLAMTLFTATAAITLFACEPPRPAAADGMLLRTCRGMTVDLYIRPDGSRYLGNFNGRGADVAPSAKSEDVCR